MLEDNLFTDVEQALKAGLEDPAHVALAGRPVPVRLVTPDPDLVELVRPVTTLQLVDVRRGFDRMGTDVEVTRDLAAGAATVRWPSAPVDLHYAVRGHTAAGRDDRLLLGQYLQFLERHPVLIGASGQRFLLARTLAFRDRSQGRQFTRVLTFVVKARLPVDLAQVVPLVQEHRVRVEPLGAA